MNNQNKVTMHTPEELLLMADNLINTNNPKMYRAAVLEAITALEFFVQIKVFENLEKKLNPLLVKWLKTKTNSDFETRLKVFTPVATNIKIDTKNNELWQRYLKAKDVRNKVAHTGVGVSQDEAMEVRDTVYAWLAFLGSTTEIEMELLKFKKYVEKSNQIINYEEEVEDLVMNYFKKIDYESHNQVRINEYKTADIILRYGDKTILIETMFLKGISDMFEKIKAKKLLTEKMLLASGISRGAILIFHDFELLETIKELGTTNDGKLSIVYIKIMAENFSFKKVVKV